jgi:hypothetical protein
MVGANRKPSPKLEDTMSQRRSSQGDRACSSGRLHVTAQNPAAVDNARVRGRAIAPATVAIWLGVGR